MSFAELGLSPLLVSAVAALEYEAPTPVQTEAIPAILRGADVWVSAQTGSGKTAAYALPMLDVLEASDPPTNRRVRALVVVPTRELATQIAVAIEKYGAHLPRAIKTVVAIGGVSINPQMMELRGGADIVVATPGRLLDLEESNAIDLSRVEMLVLDEADRLFSLGFGDELGNLLHRVPESRQTLLFSATFPPVVRSLAEQVLRNPTRITIDASATPDVSLLAQRAIAVDTGSRTKLLKHLLATEGWSQVLVFVASRHSTEHVTMKLKNSGINAACLHGDMAQSTRDGTLEAFRHGEIVVLVATDLAARGIDIAKLPAVVNYDLPRSAVDYAHRIGRTGRAGESGVAVSFITADTDAHFVLIEKRNNVFVPRETLEGFERTEIATPNRDPHGGIKGKRPNKKDKARAAAAAKKN